MKAHEHFLDPEWDGEPQDPEEPKAPGPDEAIVEPVDADGVDHFPPRPAKILVKLADGKERAIQHMELTSFWDPDGTPMSAQQFMESLFGQLPEFFQDEAELRSIWSDPGTRAKLLLGLADRGFGRDQMAEMQRVIEAEDCNLYDVLDYVDYSLASLTRAERAAGARVEIGGRFEGKQRAFLQFVLDQYVKVGVRELDAEKLSPLLRLKYHDALADAFGDLGDPKAVGRLFADFQKYLYPADALPRAPRPPDLRRPPPR